MQILNVAGGKARIAPWIISHFPEHKVYIEPYGGSAAVLIAKERAPLEVYNDLNPGLALFFQTLVSRPEELLRAIDTSLYSAVIDSAETQDTVELARRFFQLTNTTWSHSLTFKTQKRIGERDRTLLHQFEERKKFLHVVAERIRSVIFECRDAVEVIRKYDGPEVLFYVDPPYFGERKENLYEYEMADETSHRRLAETLHTCQGSVVLSGYSSALYQELYGDWMADSRLAVSNAKDQRTECLWMKGAKINGTSLQNGKKQNASIGKRIIQEAAKNTLNASETTFSTLSVYQRAIFNGITPPTQAKLDHLAKFHPDLLLEVQNGKLKTLTAYRRCGTGRIKSALQTFKLRFLKLSSSEQEEAKAWISTDPVRLFENLSGRQFGKWIVLEQQKKEKNQLYWRCRCECGNLKWVLSGHLKSGRSRCCGKSSCNSKLINLSGQQFGYWKVLCKYKLVNGHPSWRCQCQCGKIKWIIANNLKRGRSQSCGCSRRKTLTVAPLAA